MHHHPHQHRLAAHFGIALGLVACLTIGLLACLGSLQVSAEAAGAAPSPRSVEIVIRDFVFDPRVVTISPGTSVVWRNLGAFPHTAQSDTGIWNSGALAPEGTFSHTFDTTGTFPFHCGFHPSMTGEVVVRYRVYLPVVLRLAHP